MFLILDTWLDNKIPVIRVISKETGQSVLIFEGDEVQHLIDQGIINGEDLYNRDSVLEKEMIYELFIFSKQKNHMLHDELIRKKTYNAVKPENQKKIGSLCNIFNRFEYLRKMFITHKLFNYHFL